MAAGRPSSFDRFTCPNCRALYDVVRVEAGPETVVQDVFCRACDAPIRRPRRKVRAQVFHVAKSGSCSEITALIITAMKNPGQNRPGLSRAKTHKRRLRQRHRISNPCHMRPFREPRCICSASSVYEALALTFPLTDLCYVKCLLLERAHADE